MQTGSGGVRHCESEQVMLLWIRQSRIGRCLDQRPLEIWTNDLVYNLGLRNPLMIPSPIASLFQYVAPGCTPSLPPSTTWMLPLQNAPARDAKYNTDPAISSSLPARPRGWLLVGALPSRVRSLSAHTACVISDKKTAPTTSAPWLMAVDRAATYVLAPVHSLGCAIAPENSRGSWSNESQQPC